MVEARLGEAEEALEEKNDEVGLGKVVFALTLEVKKEPFAHLRREKGVKVLEKSLDLGRRAFPLDRRKELPRRG